METLDEIDSEHLGLLVPTRWGNQLNGNFMINPSDNPRSIKVPTRWGNQLNGNNQFSTLYLDSVLSPLAGETN